MFARKGLFSSIGRTGAVATVVAVALMAIEPSMAFAGSATSGKGVTASAGTSDATDISARRRHYRGGGAAAAAAFAGIVGTGLAIAAAQSRRDYYDGGYGNQRYPNYNNYRQHQGYQYQPPVSYSHYGHPQQNFSSPIHQLQSQFRIQPQQQHHNWQHQYTQQQQQQWRQTHPHHRHG